MSSFNRCLAQTASQVAVLLPDAMRNDTGKYLAAIAIAGATAFSAPDASAQSQSQASRWGERIGGVVGATVANEVLRGSSNTPIGRVFQDAGRSVAEDAGRDVGRKVFGKADGNSANWSDKLDTAALTALLAVDDRAQLGPNANYRTPGWDAANSRVNRARDAFDTVYRSASYDRFNIQPWRPIDSALRARFDVVGSNELAQLALAPMERLNRQGGPGFQVVSQPRVTMRDIRAAATVGGDTNQQRSTDVERPQ